MTLLFSHYFYIKWLKKKMKAFMKAWTVANLTVALLVSPLVVHHYVNGDNTTLEEPTEQVNHWEDYQSKWY